MQCIWCTLCVCALRIVDIECIASCLILQAYAWHFIIIYGFAFQIRFYVCNNRKLWSDRVRYIFRMLLLRRKTREANADWKWRWYCVCRNRFSKSCVLIYSVLLHSFPICVFTPNPLNERSRTYRSRAHIGIHWNGKFEKVQIVISIY